MDVIYQFEEIDMNVNRSLMGVYPEFDFTEYREPEKPAPVCCPVCSGKGLVPNGFYLCNGGLGYTTTDATPDVCRSCNGNGVLWPRK